MQSIINHLHFLRPSSFALLPVIAVLLWLYQRRKVSSRSWRTACDPELLSQLLVGGSEGEAGRKGLYLLGLVSLLATFALAGPVWKQLETPVFRDESALVLILDLSRSMDATDIKPTRLSRARHKLIDILKGRKEGQTALVIYAGGAFVVSPLTQDAKTIISQVSALKTTLIPRQGSRPDLAISKAGQLLKQAGVPKGEVLLITDGLENVLKDALAEAQSKLLSSGHRLSILGVGTLEGAPIKLPKGGYFRDKHDRLVIPKLDEADLSAMAQKGGGRYLRIANDDSDIDSLFATSALRGLEDKQEDTGLKTDRWREEGPWLLLCLLPFAALAFRRGILSIILFGLVLSLPPYANALDWDTLWSRPDQRAQEIFEQGEESSAATLFEDPEWKSAAHYRTGNYQKSIEALEGIQTPDALYNKGNALAQLGQLPEAITAYDEALKLDPEHEDAAYNKEQIEEQLSQDDQNQNKQKDGESSENSEDSEDSEESGEQDSNKEEQEGEDSESGEQEEEQNQEGEDQNSESEQENQQESDSSEKEDGESEQDTQQTEPHEKEEQDESDSEDNEVAKSGEQDELNETDEQKESKLALEQWLRRIPDDPGGLLRRKFLYQSQQQPATNREEEGW